VGLWTGKVARNGGRAGCAWPAWNSLKVEETYMSNDNNDVPVLTLDELAWIKTETLLRDNDPEWRRLMADAVMAEMALEGLAMDQEMPRAPGQAMRVVKAAYLRVKAGLHEKPWVYVPPSSFEKEKTSS
jgi:hypothetical protein